MTTPETDKTISGGLVVFFEGMDGTGKTTQLDLAATALRGDGWAVETTRAHGGTPIGEALRSVSLSPIQRPALTDLHISLAIHAALAEQVMDWREAGFIVLIDRGPLSIAAYQLYGDGLDDKIVWPAVEADMNLFNPELLLVYQATVATAMERARHKQGGGSDYFESKDKAYFDRVNQGYAVVANQFNVPLIDVETASIPEVSSQTLGYIQALITAKRG